MFIEPGSPLLQYYDFGGDLYIEDIRHNKGGYPVFLPQGTEVLARYDYPSKSDVHMQPSAWSYKENSHQGRIVMEGSHPEEVADGERRDFTASMILYAIDGLGNTSLKGFLQNGRPRQMDKSTEDKVPSFTKIGDKQYESEILSSDLKIYVASSPRVDGDDKSGVQCNVDNTSTIPVFIKVANDDASSPRFTLGTRSGSVKVY